MIEVIGSVIQALNTSRYLVVWDGYPKFRRTIHPAYKIRHERQLTAEEKQAREMFTYNLVVAKDAFTRLGVPQFEESQSEADDVIGLAASLVRKEIVATAMGSAPPLVGLPGELQHIVINSDDKDYYQLLRGSGGKEATSTTVWRGIKYEHMDMSRFTKLNGFAPERYVDYKALVGESSTGDNIPGVHGIGDKTAAKLVALHGDINGILAFCKDQATKPKCLRAYSNIAAAEEDVRLSYRLSQIFTVEARNQAMTDRLCNGHVGSVVIPKLADQLRHAIAPRTISASILRKFISKFEFGSYRVGSLARSIGAKPVETKGAW